MVNLYLQNSIIEQCLTSNIYLVIYKIAFVLKSFYYCNNGKYFFVSENISVLKLRANYEVNIIEIIIK